uniref:Uncharacterized protein n=1 Tax=Phylloscopus inornatus parvoviridae sp. TaxID=2794539 RepID=A0A8A4XE64_9VIRU|nr:MAG: hypothetical protein [Phylloscopus inornatus parvoviridae sp.]
MDSIVYELDEFLKQLEAKNWEEIEYQDWLSNYLKCKETMVDTPLDEWEKFEGNADYIFMEEYVIHILSGMPRHVDMPRFAYIDRAPNNINYFRYMCPRSYEKQTSWEMIPPEKVFMTYQSPSTPLEDWYIHEGDGFWLAANEDKIDPEKKVWIELNQEFNMDPIMYPLKWFPLIRDHARYVRIPKTIHHVKDMDMYQLYEEHCDFLSLINE